MPRLKAKQVGKYITKNSYVLSKCTFCGRWTFKGSDKCPKCHAEFRGAWYKR